MEIDVCKKGNCMELGGLASLKGTRLRQNQTGAGNTSNGTAFLLNILLYDSIPSFASDIKSLTNVGKAECTSVCADLLCYHLSG